MPVAEAAASAAASAAATAAAGAAWWAWIAPVSVQAAIFTALVLVLDRLLARRGWPQLRHTLWLLAALRFALPPTLASPVGLGAWLGPGPQRGPGAWPGESLARAADVAPHFDASWPFAVWLAGAATATAITLRQRRRAGAALHGRPAPARIRRIAGDAARRLRLRRVPRVVVVADLPSACVRGLLRPVIALPANTARADVEPMLLHELAHVKRRDLWIVAALSALCVVFWFHPAAWLVKRRVAHVRELCCDETVAVALGPRVGEYRATLLCAAARLVGETSPEPAFLGLPSQIVARLRSLECGPARHPRLRSATTASFALLLGTCVLPMARPAAPVRPGLDAARRLVASAMDGSERPGCLRLHLAAMALTADSLTYP